MGHIYEFESGPPSLEQVAEQNREKLDVYEQTIAGQRDEIKRLLLDARQGARGLGAALEQINDYEELLGHGALSTMTPEKRQSVTLEAHRLVYGDRQGSYGHPLDDFGRTAKLWSAILNVEVSPEQVGLCMCLLKISRECCKHGRDNLCDLAGYAETVHRVIEERKRREQEDAE